MIGAWSSSYGLTISRKNTLKKKRYQFQRLPFGLKPSPTILASTIEQHLSRQNETDPVVVELLKISVWTPPVRVET